MDSILRQEYPRPQFRRPDWMTLNGMWDFSFDEEIYDRKIRVPFVYEAPLSGIGVHEFHDVIWYRREFPIPREWAGKQILLHIGSVDYVCDVWVNGRHMAHHVGGQTGFCIDITPVIKNNGNQVRVRVQDYPVDLDIPRGKQFWKEESESIFYTASMGIWQSVWLEPVEAVYIEQVLITPLFDEKAVRFDYELNQWQDCTLETEITFQGKTAGKMLVSPVGKKGTFCLQLDEAALGGWNVTEDFAWTPEHPRLFDVEYRLKQRQETVDTVKSYFGMRKVSIASGKFLLNNRPYYQRLILDQGYWPEGLMSAPSDEDYIKDITLIKQMGFNGVRKHQKAEDPRFLYHADRMGLLVWGENASGYVYSRRLAQDLLQEWSRIILRDYNHPSIVAWTPLNESWGVLEIANRPEQQEFCRALAAFTKALDLSRPVSDNDGWEHVDSDLLTIHDYESREEVLKERYASLEQIINAQPAGRPLYTEGSGYHGEPIIVSEFGGISYAVEGAKGWGYSTAGSARDFLERYRNVIEPILKSPHIQGFCYTQLTDIEQEINGLLTYDRAAKVDLEQIRRITSGETITG